MHKAKGLEYDVVFCPYLWTSREVTTPFTARDERGFVFVADDDVAGPYHAAAERARLAEDVRLAYVALTRAKHRCYVLWGKFGKGGKEPFGSALGWLLRPMNAPMTAGEADVDTLRAAWEKAEESDGLIAALTERLIGLTDSGAVSVCAPPPLDQSKRRMEPPEPVQPVACPLPATIAAALRPWSLTSFTGLTSVRDGRAPSGGAHDTNAGDEPAARQQAAEQAVAADLLPSLPPGAAAGIAVHALIEHGDFHTPPAGEAIAKALRLAGCRVSDPAQAEREITAMLERLATQPVPPVQADAAPWCLRDTDAAKRHVEWEFLLPLERLDLGRVVAVFRDAGGLLAESADALAHLPQRTVRGFLRGFADLVLEHDGRWWVLDWKTNRLPAYGPTDLRTAMVGHHYVLQYHLYLLGLHCFLAARLPDYDYDRHIGGAAYVFVRGLADGQGWFVDRPDQAVITALAECLVPAVFTPAGSATPD
jgi:exodeoxyribonuclease V beta subunit